MSRLGQVVLLGLGGGLMSGVAAQSVPGVEAAAERPPVRASLESVAPAELKGVDFGDVPAFWGALYPSQIAPLVDAALNRPMDIVSAEVLRQDINKVLFAAGYVNSGVMRLKWDPQTGVLQFRVIAGRVTNVLIRGQGRLPASLLARRLWPQAQETFNLQELQQRILQLSEDPMIERVDLQVLPGAEPGQAELSADIVRRRPWELTMQLNNQGSRTTGQWLAGASLTVHSPLGLADTMQLGYSQGHGRGYSAWQWRQSVPVGSAGATVEWLVSHGDTGITAGSLAPLNITSNTDQRQLTLNLPLDAGWGLSFQLAHTRTNNYLDGQAFSFTSAEQEGRVRSTALRLGQTYALREDRQALSMMSSLSVGLPVDGASTSSAGSRFTVWRGAAAWLSRSAGLQGGTWLFNTVVQISADSLLPQEGFALGGGQSVRAYAPNAVVRDQGVFASVEHRWPVDLPPDWGSLSVSGFLDAGWAWNVGTALNPDRSRRHLLGLGAGLHWTFARRATLEVGYAVPIGQGAQEASLARQGFSLRMGWSL